MSEMNGTNGAAPKLRQLDPRQVRSQNILDVDLGDGTFVKCRREDMTLLVFEGRVPMAMLSAVQKMIDMPDSSPVERIEALGVDAGRSLIEVVRHHACRVAMSPLLVMEEDGNPDHLPVHFLTVPQLMAIWSATAVIPQVGPAAAATFRELTAQPDAAPVADVPGVPPAPEPVVDPAPVVIERMVSR